MRKARNSMFFKISAKGTGTALLPHEFCLKLWRSSWYFQMVYFTLQMVRGTLGCSKFGGRAPLTLTKLVQCEGGVPLLPRVRKETHTFVHRSMHPMMALQNLH